ncbi:sodium:proton antiporter [Alicyclobacillus cellulosilyticus]|uniref:Sodium:proton antiporter n=1 Tax=Alicyclobacillus cellulosilyticus TaxID=1003997 RepID=A0A917NFQ6_9BACL|nr:cation:proton antiporter [Alicyclobacillus cellulosilyticus]GGI96690.1 sodium:proton antiporter [Alicyclobacillus cellulosilyticus]
MAQALLTTLLIIFVAGTLGGKLAARLHIPDVVVYVVMGMLIGPPGFGIIDIDPRSALYQVILLAGASFILFHGGMVTHLATLRRVWLSISLLSTVGVVVTAFVVALAASLIFHVPWLTGLLLGAIVASTDPAALVPIFQKVPVRSRIAHTVVSESAFTDATGAILTTVVLGVTAAGGIHPAAIGWRFVQLALGGILIGGVIGWVTAFLISENDRGLLREFTPMAVVLSVLGSYLVAEWLHTSGFMSVFTAGLIVGNARSFRLTILEKEEHAAHAFIDAVGLKFRMLIFVLLGSQVDVSALTVYGWRAVLVAAVFMFVARPLTVLCSLLPDRAAKWRRNEILFFFWTRETGVIAAALAGMVSGSGAAYGKLISAVVFVIILATLLVQASTTPRVARRLGLLEPRT